jgi:hypothetical protein
MDKELERLRINQLLGRRLSRPVVGPDSQLLIEEGERITPSTVAKARESGVLEVLLDAADEGSESDAPV